ncbi:hypothetical protein YC2023_079557 [Brassica napus]
MRCTRGARRLRRCGLCLFVLMVSGLLSATTLSFVGILRSVRLLVAGTLMMISFRTTLLLLPQTNQTIMCFNDVWIDASVSVSILSVLKHGTNSIIITLDLFTNERGVYSHCFLV